MNVDQMAAKAWSEKCVELEKENKILKDELLSQMKVSDEMLTKAVKSVKLRRWVECLSWLLLMACIALAGVGVLNHRLTKEVESQKAAIERAWAHSFERDLIMAEQSALLIGKKKPKHRRMK